MTRMSSAEQPVSPMMVSVICATAAAESPSTGAGTAAVTPSEEMYTTQSEKSLARSRFSICVSCIDQVAIAAMASMAPSIVSCEAPSPAAAVSRRSRASSREVWRVSRARAK